jgi:hypothetical protein
VLLLIPLIDYYSAAVSSAGFSGSANGYPPDSSKLTGIVHRPEQNIPPDRFTWLT